ncbi:hypothetical protein [Brevundimonas sp.]|uniref:hypothetical protein n=1 Tax=Brevundimonas sp. TaxID=1871086 RepID=UPI0028A5C90A|nr:hypothetical protein [Brevundimonas sp.]
MLLSFYFPLFDSRDFLPEREAKTRRPVWPNLDRARPVFQRNLGRIVERPLGGVRGWVAESDICEVRSSLKIANSRPVFQRFFSDGWGGGYFSVGFDVSSHDLAARSETLADLVSRLAGIEVRSKHVKDSVDVLGAGRLVAELYGRGTTKTHALPSRKSVFDAPPIVVVQGDGSRIGALFGRSMLSALPSGGGRPAQIAYSKINVRRGVPATPVFAVLGSNSAIESQATRLSRMVLARLYGELFVFENCLRLLEGAIDRLDKAGLDSLLQRVGMASNRLQGSLRPALVAEPTDYAALVNLFTSSHDPGRVDELVTMLDRLKLTPNFKTAVLRTAKPLLDGQGTTHVTNSTYNIHAQTVGAVGDGASATNFGQDPVALSNVELPALAAELGQLLSSIRGHPDATPERIEAVEAAKQAAEAGDTEATKSALAKLGDWGGKFATAAGAGVVAAVIKTTLGF